MRNACEGKNHFTPTGKEITGCCIFRQQSTLLAKKNTKELKVFLKPYSAQVQEMVLWLRDFVWDLYPSCNELIYDNYNAVAIGWSVTDKMGGTFCTVSAWRDYAHFGFYYGNELSDPEKRLSGTNQYRHIKVAVKKDFPAAYIKKLLKEAYANSLAKLKGKAPGIQGATIVKSVLAKKKRPGGQS